MTGELAPVVVVGLDEQRFAVAFAVVDEVEDLVGELEQADGVGAVCAASSEAFGQFGGGDVESSSRSAIVLASSLVVKADRALASDSRSLIAGEKARETYLGPGAP